MVQHSPNPQPANPPQQNALAPGQPPGQPMAWAPTHPPMQGYPQAGYPPQGYPPPGYPAQGHHYPQQGYQGYQGYPPPGYPPQPINVVVQNTVGAYAGGGLQRVRIANRSKGAALVLCLFLGGVGAHRFYLGQTGLGVVYLLFCWTFIPAFIALIDLLILLVMPSREFELRFNYS